MEQYLINKYEAGVDEAGRGPLIGPVFVGAVVFGNVEPHEYIKDSKKLSAKKRKIAKEWIEENVYDYSVAYSDYDIIDEYNIFEATKMAVEQAIKSLDNQPTNVVIDGCNWGNMDERLGLQVNNVIKGDDKYLSIAAASILAKEYHDEFIINLCNENPELNQKYDLINNKGYGTKKHREGIKLYGLSKFHRKSFKLKS